MEEQIKQFKSKYKLNQEQMKELVVPPIGTKFHVNGIVYVVVYSRLNPARFSAEPIGVVPPVEENKPTATAEKEESNDKA